MPASNFMMCRHLNASFHNVNGEAQIQVQTVTQFPAHLVTPSGSSTKAASLQKHKDGLSCPGSLGPSLLAHQPVLGPLGLLCP